MFSHVRTYLCAILVRFLHKRVVDLLVYMFVRAGVAHVQPS